MTGLGKWLSGQESLPHKQEDQSSDPEYPYQGWVLRGSLARQPQLKTVPGLEKDWVLGGKWSGMTLSIFLLSLPRHIHIYVFPHPCPDSWMGKDMAPSFSLYYQCLTFYLSIQVCGFLLP